MDEARRRYTRSSEKSARAERNRNWKYGSGAVGQMVATGNMLIYSNVSSDGTPHLFALDKDTGEELAKVEVPSGTRYGMSSWVHEGKQYVILQTGAP